MAGPFGLSQQLDSIERRRRMADAIRLAGLRPTQTNVVGGAVLPDLGLDKFVNTYEGKRQGDELDRESQEAIGGFEQKQQQATQQLMEVGDAIGQGEPVPTEVVSKVISQATTAGVPPELIKAVMASRGQQQFLNGMDGGNPLRQGPQQAPSGPQGAPMPQGGVSGGFSPQNAPAPSNRGSFPQVSDKAALVMSTMGGMPGEMGKAILKEREVKVEGGMAYDNRGNLIGGMKDGIQYVSNGKGGFDAVDLAGDTLAVREAKIAAARLASQVVTTQDAQGRPVTTFASQLPGAPQSGGRPAPKWTGDRPPTPEELATIQAIEGQGLGGMPSVGVGPSPGEIEAQKQGAITAGERDRATQVPRFDAPTGQYTTAPAAQAPGTAQVPEGYTSRNNVPAAIREQMAKNEVTLGKIIQARQLATQYPGAFGLKNYAGDAVMQRVDPEGVNARAIIADIAGQKIHDRSGAAVTVGEAARLKPYIPASTDDAPTVLKKLAMFESEYKSMQEELAKGFSLGQATAKRDKPAGPKTVKWSDLP